MEAAVFGLVGVLLGALITVVREWFFQWRKERKEAAYLCAQVIGLLHRFIAGCSEVASDAGEHDFNTDTNVSRVNAPVFHPEKIVGDWKALPAALMYEVLDFPYQVEVAQQRVAGAFEHLASPPDYEEGYSERQWQYTLLGLDAARIAEKLREHARFPSRPADDDWDPVQHLLECHQDLQKQRQSAA